VTTRSVADRAGVNKALVHYHFGSVDLLLVSAVTEAFSAEVPAGIEVVLGPEDPADGLVAFGRWLAERPDDPGNDRILLEALSQATLREDVRALFVPALAEFRAALGARLAAQGIRDAEALATAIGALLDGIAIHRVLDPGVDAASTLTAVATLLRAARPGRAEGH
jgi:AcrR family transcriptional regulator